MGKNDASANPTTFELVHPKLPFKWIATSFIVPVLIVAVPHILSYDSLSLNTLVIVALSVLAVFLFISCIQLTLKAYDYAFETQRQLLIIDRINETLKDTEDLVQKQADQVHKQINEFEKLNARISNMVESSELLNKRIDQLEKRIN